LRSAAAPHLISTLSLHDALPISSLLTANGGNDVDNDGKADPGDTIAYVLSVANTSGAAATALAIANPLDSHTTLVGGSLNSTPRSEEHTSELQSLRHLVCRLLLE